MSLWKRLWVYFLGVGVEKSQSGIQVKLVAEIGPEPRKSNYVSRLKPVQRLSPNFKKWPGRKVTMVVVHSTASDKAEPALNWMCDPKSVVSAHYCIGKAGEIWQLVGEEDVAFHAGASEWMGTRAINLLSVGIELVNRNDVKDHYTAPQLVVLTQLVNDLVARHAIQKHNIVRHLDIALPAGRKTDPAGFPWQDWLDGLDAS